MATRALVIIEVSPRRILSQPGSAYQRPDSLNTVQSLSAFTPAFKVSAAIIIRCLGIIAGLSLVR